jgi:hypothetical protein
MSGFVPDDFVVPGELVAGGFRLEPLGPQHNEGDYRAWMSSIEHIRSTPGFQGRSWPEPEMTLAENRGDLEQHAGDFAARSGFTYTVLAEDGGEIVGCVYIYPAADGRQGDAGEVDAAEVAGVDAAEVAGVDAAEVAGVDAAGGAEVRSWVRADRADLDLPLYEAVSAWLREGWPFATIAYAPR